MACRAYLLLLMNEMQSNSKTCTISFPTLGLKYKPKEIKRRLSPVQTCEDRAPRLGSIKLIDSKGGKRLQRLLTVVLFTFLFALAPKLPLAQVYSSVDTVSTLSAGGFPGDTVIVSFDLVNTFAVGGFQLRMTYDTTIFEPLAMHLSTRSESLEVCGGYFGEAGVAELWALSWHPLEHAIPPGRGVVASLDIAILDGAIPGIYQMRFEDSDSLSHENGLSTAMGDTLVIPIFVERQIFVQPVESAGDPGTLPDEYGLAQNYPNPFNGQTRISFNLREPKTVELTIFDILGRLVATPFVGEAPAGESAVVWNGKTSGGAPAISGIYFYRLSDSGGTSVTKKLTLLK
jgi:hypothetical protein